MDRRRFMASVAASVSTVGSTSGVSALTYNVPPSIESIKGRFETDGSSTLAPLTEAVIEDFARIARNVRITNGVSGTGGGFERFARGEVVVANASRHIKSSEADACMTNGIEWFQFDVARDGIVVAISAENDFIDALSMEELADIWAADGNIRTWADVRPNWPATVIELFGPGMASGTSDFFHDAILGDRLIRTDFTPSEDDNVLVQGVAGSANALGYFGYSFYEENADLLHAIAIDAGDGAIAPSTESIADGSYAALSRTLFIYANAIALQTRAEVAEFLRFYAASASNIAPEVGFVSLSEAEIQATWDKVQNAIEVAIPPDSEVGQ